MNECCPTCGQALPSQPDPIETLRRWCIVRGHWLGPFDEIKEDAAAELCDRAPETLRFWRGTDRRLPCRKTKAGWRYRLADLAVFLADDDESKC